MKSLQVLFLVLVVLPTQFPFLFGAPPILLFSLSSFLFADGVLSKGDDGREYRGALWRWMLMDWWMVYGCRGIGGFLERFCKGHLEPNLRVEPDLR